MAADLSSLDLVAFIVDGVHFAGHCCVVALGIDIEGNKHPLALEEGDTENATLVKDLIVGLRERGLDVTRPILAVLDGSKALASAVTAVLRWCAAGMFEAKKQFRRVNGHLHLRSLRTALNQHVQETVTPFNYSPDKEVAA
jgi:putative transposase